MQVREFSPDSFFHDPCLTYVLHDVMCTNCNATRDLDLARDTVRLRHDGGTSRRTHWQAVLHVQRAMRILAFVSHF